MHIYMYIHTHIWNEGVSTIDDSLHLLKLRIQFYAKKCKSYSVYYGEIARNFTKNNLK